MHEEAVFYHEPHFWVAAAFVLFVALFIKYILPSVNKALDARAADIAQQLEQANRLRAEAEALLQASQMQQEAVLREAQTILSQAESDAREIAQRAESDLKQTMARRMAQADEKIMRAQQQAVARLRSQMVEVATETARQVIAAHVSASAEDPAIARAITSIERKLH